VGDVGDFNGQEIDMIIKAHRWSKLLILISMTGFLFNCASSKIKVDLPVTHPAHPQAQEASFSPVANPFTGGLSESMDPAEPHRDQAETSTHQEKGGGHHDHSMNPDEDRHPGDKHREDHHQKPRGGTDQ
jgi:hypothetical protein